MSVLSETLEERELSVYYRLVVAHSRHRISGPGKLGLFRVWAASCRLLSIPAKGKPCTINVE